MARLISVETALGLIAQTARLQPVIELGLAEADGHVLAEDIHARTTLPPLPASAMDGYAVKLQDSYGPGTKLALIGVSPAGAPFEGKVGPGEAVRIYTGGAVPEGADLVIMQENVEAFADHILLKEPISTSTHIRDAGIDFHEGDVLMKAGTRLNGYGLAVVAAANHDRVKVRKQPKVALIANGDELVAPGGDLGPGQIISSNPYGLAPLLSSWGADVIDAGISKDDPAAIKAQIERCQTADILVPIGGASVGDRDYMRSVFAELGYEKVFEKVAVKPGKPVWFGTLADKYVLGLPGNPASALVTAEVFLRHLVTVLSGAQDGARTLNARITTGMKASTWRTEYIRAKAVVDAQGQIHVTPFPRQDSSLLTPFLSANCLLIRPANAPALLPGDVCQILPLGPLADV